MAKKKPARKAPKNYAGFWIRFGAFLIDTFILILIGLTLSLIARPSDLIYGFVNFLIGLSYFAWLESSDKQATLGKQLFGLKVTDINGKRISFEKALARYISKFLSSITLGIGYLMIGFTEKKQGLHDMVSNTLVLRNK